MTLITEDQRRLPLLLLLLAGLHHSGIGTGKIKYDLRNYTLFFFCFSEVVKKGIFENENIMIHVGQNLFNFIMTTLAWFTVSQIYSLTAAKSSAGNAREQKALSLTEAADEVLEAIRKFEHQD